LAIDMKAMAYALVRLKNESATREG